MPTLLEPHVSLRAAASADARLRQGYLRLDSQIGGGTRGSVVGEDRRDASDEAWTRWAGVLAHSSARYLELLLASVCLWEELAAAWATSVEVYVAVRGAEALRAAVCARSGLDPVAVADNARDFLTPAVLQEAQAHAGDGRISADALVRVVRAQLDACPIRDVQAAAAAAGHDAWGWRAVAACNGLRLFLLRNDPAVRTRVDAIGELYQIGRLTTTQVTELLGMDQSDTIALLELAGYARAPQAIALPENERAVRLGAIRADRLRRAGTASDFGRYVDRAVVASERIEGVDARRWIFGTRPE
ncbi:MAG: hypothetical protein M3154_11660 [Candidatus Eremiobacteraeota bacterium]|nr:hypothetical protein [Candidatus Eremiobacteraeota bacterium]